MAKWHDSASERIWKIGEKPIVLAHRAGGNEAPENSLTAFTKMEQLGFRYIETDVHSTKDGVVIIFHDSALERTTNGKGKVAQYSWNELKEIRDDSGNGLLRLDEVLEKYPNLFLNIDAKTSHVVPSLVHVISSKNAFSRISLASFSEPRLKRLRKMLPGMVSSLGQEAIALLVLQSKLPKKWQPYFDWLVPGVKKGVQAVQIPAMFGKIKVLTPQLIELCHRRKQAVHIWTVNEATEMLEFLAMGVDAIITDEPSLARRVIDFYWENKY